MSVEKPFKDTTEQPESEKSAQEGSQEEMENNYLNKFKELGVEVDIKIEVGENHQPDGPGTQHYGTEAIKGSINGHQIDLMEDFDRNDSGFGGSSTYLGHIDGKPLSDDVAEKLFRLLGETYRPVLSEDAEKEILDIFKEAGLV